MKNNKKSQISFFIIIGFVILIIMSLIFYMQRSQSEKKTESENFKARSTTFDVSSVKSYIDVCLQKTAKEGIILLGDQGGRIDQDQGGSGTRPSNFYTKFDDKDTKVSYGLIRIPLKPTTQTYLCESSTINITCENNNTPATLGDSDFKGGRYPWVQTSTQAYQPFPKPSYARNCIGDGCFGSNTLPGINDEDDSMYKQLEIYISNTFDSCIDFSIFNDQGLEVKENKTLSVNVETTDETVIVVLNYTVLIKDLNTNKITKLNKFYHDTNVRLEYIHNIAYGIVQKDKVNESFDARSFVDSDIDITVLRDNQAGVSFYPKDDNIVKIIDHFSTPPFIFQFARQNRYPALELLDPVYKLNLTGISPDKTYSFNENFFNFVKSHDPDEDETTLYFTSIDNKMGLKRNKTFSYLLEEKHCDDVPPRGIGFAGSFLLRVCVSDNHHSPYSCVPGFDMSMDWQDINITIDNC
jgi:hypothetical protein